MSSRALRKLQGDPEIIVPGLDVGSSEDEDSLNPSTVPNRNKTKKKSKKRVEAVNPFDLLNEYDVDGNDEVKDDQGDEEHQVMIQEKIDGSDDVTVVTESTTIKAAESTGAKAKKRKKKKKKNKSEVRDEDQNKEKDEDDIDASIRQVNELLGELPSNSDGAFSESPTPVTMDMRALLNVEHRYLDAANEMKRLFGSRVVQAEQSKKRNRSRVYHRQSWLARPKDNWPHMVKTGLTMSMTESKQGYNYFIFEHNRQYQQVQFQFLDAVESLNPQNIVEILNAHPYHIDAQLQLSEVCRLSEDVQMATELIERCLYCFECAFHPRFSLTHGTCRLDYRRPENRAFYLALFRHLNFVGQRGCYRTSLEFCKLLLSLDPDGDPLCVMLMIDFYALRADQFTFLIRMYREWEAHRNLSQLPNFAFSVALAMFHQATLEGSDTTEANNMLQRSLIMFPGLLMPLLDQCSVQPDSEVAAHPFFSSTSPEQIRQPDALRQLISLYVGRCCSCWKVPEVMTWLEVSVKEVLKRVDSQDPLVEESRQKRQSRYRGTPRNIYRHILISEVKDATASLPPELASTAVLSYDPLPPTDSITSYVRPPRPRRVDQDSSHLSMFFRSLLPNFNPQEMVEEGGAVGGQQANDFRQGIGALMDAMRDLLNNIRPVEPPVENQDQQGDGEHDDHVEEWD